MSTAVQFYIIDEFPPSFRAMYIEEMIFFADKDKLFDPSLRLDAIDIVPRRGEVVRLPGAARSYKDWYVRDVIHYPVGGKAYSGGRADVFVELAGSYWKR